MTRQPYPSDVSDEERAFVASTGSGAALPLPPLPPPAGGGKGGAQRAPAMTGINVPPFHPPHAGGKGGAARSTWLKRFITVMLEST